MRSKKNRKKMIIAAALGVFATFSFFSYMGNQKAVTNDLITQIQKQNSVISDLKKNTQANPFTPKEPEEKKFSAVIASRDIKVGETFVQDSMKTQDYLEEELPEGYYKTVASVVGNIAGKNITAGQFITEEEIQSEAVTTIDIPRGMRAITIPVSQFKGLASHIRVGTKVDLLNASNPPEFIAQNIKIVAFELNGSSKSSNDRYSTKSNNKNNPLYLAANQASAITFIVPTDIVAEVAEAMTRGNLQVLTRNHSDQKVIITEEDLPPPPDMAAVPAAPPIEELPVEIEKVPEPKMPPPPPTEVEIIKAGNVSTLTFNNDGANSSGSNKPTGNTSPGGNLTKLKELLELVE